MIVSSEILIQIPEVGKHLTGNLLKGIVKFRLDQDAVYERVTLTLVEKTCSRYDYTNIADYCTIPIKAGELSQYQTRKVVKTKFLNENTDEVVILRTGSHEHPFQMTIPENTPPSVKITDKGRTLAGIRHFLILKFKRLEMFSLSDYFITKLTIYPKIDSSSTEKPLIASLEKTLTKLFSTKKHDIQLKAELDKEYLIPGSERKIIFIVNNNSDLIFTVQSELICKSKISLRFQKAIEKIDVLATVETPSIPDNSISNMFNIIPVALELYTVRHSEVITREYTIRVTLRLPTPYSNAFVEIPVFVGERVV